MRHRDVRDQALAEERALALVGAVDELVDQHEGAGRQLLLERAAGRERDQIGDAGALEHVDIGAVVDVGGRQPVALVVARQEHDRQAGDLADAQGPGRLAPGAFDALLAHVLQARQIVDAGAADDAENGFGHAPAASDHPQTKGPRTGPSRHIRFRCSLRCVVFARILPVREFARRLDLVPDLLLGEVQQAREHDQEDHHLEADALALRPCAARPPTSGTPRRPWHIARPSAARRRHMSPGRPAAAAAWR